MLLIVTFFWGVTFPIIKVALDYISPAPFLAIRFALASAMMLIFV
ncbi:MAG: EamA family transporter, partial [Candidatus Thermoplasmatota archaeon]|nr:EamA family transporter [Candidatus Thermoplasmatota archaeon]